MNTREEAKEASEKLEDLALEEEEANEGALFDPEKEKEIEDLLEEDEAKKRKKRIQFKRLRKHKTVKRQKRKEEEK
ncbi:MAG: hypothetical protein KAX27_06955 [Candidatus Aminicenantes bacterium]|nr:hypothetical protein [Candidatus Aminicenantes bacterium]